MWEGLQNVSLAMLFSSWLLGGSSVSAQSQTVYVPSGGELALIESSTLIVSDKVEDKCWTNPNSVRSRVYLTLEQNGIFVPDYTPKFYNFRTVATSLSALGFRASNGTCAVTASFLVQTLVRNELGGADGMQKFSYNYLPNVFERSAIFTSNRNANDQLKDFFEGAVSEFVAKILSAQKTKEYLEYRALYPSTGEPPISVKDWDAMMEDFFQERSN